VLLRAGLVDDAVRSARAACELSERLGWQAAEAEARLLLSLTLLEAGDAAASASEAARARALLTRQDRPAWAALARYVAARADLALDPGAGPAERAADVASSLRDLGWESPAAELRIEAGRRAIEARRSRRAHEVLGPLAASTRSTRPEIRTRAWLARALLDEADGKAPDSEAALRRAWRLLDDQRLLVGATDLRAGGGALAADVVAAGVRMAVAKGSADSCFAWAERGRAAVLRFRRIEQPTDTELARALTRLRWAARAEGDALRNGEPVARIDRERRRREQEVLRISRSAPRSRRVTVPAARRDVSAALRDDETFVHLLNDGTHLHAIAIRSTSRQLVPLGASGEAAAYVENARFCLRRLLSGFGTGAGLDAARASLDRALADLDRLFLSSVRDLLGDGAVVLCPTHAVAAAPWSLLPSLRGRALSVAPSAALWLLARARRAEDRGGPVVAVAGPGLPHATAEAGEVAAAHVGSRVLVGTDATVTAVLAAAEGASVLHLAAHGRLRRDNPMFSDLVLADGPLTLLELERLADAPRDVVLPACGAGDSHGRGSADLLGLSLGLLGAGSASVIAPVVAVPDAATRTLMAGLHSRLAAGDPPAHALAAAHRAAVANDDGLTAALAGAFLCFGD